MWCEIKIHVKLKQFCQMRNRAQKRLFTPVIGRVTNLNDFILSKRKKIKKSLQYNYVDDMIKQCYLLFKYALRQLSGKDYVKRACELCEEIQCSAYLITRLGGFTKEECATIDVTVDEILDEIVKISKSGQAPELSHDEW